ncbi:MAG: transcription-repair coupling factor, partial [Planctomycetota bacterium]
RDDLDDLGVPAVLLPELDEHEAMDQLSENDRLLLARRLAAIEAAQAGAVIVASPRSADQPLPAPGNGRRALRLRPGDEIAPQDLAERLVDEGYKVAAMVEQPGQLAVRGGIVDVFPLAAEQPLRLEFFGDEIDGIRRFDPFTQEGISRCDVADIVGDGALVPDHRLWQLLSPQPIVVCGDVSLRSRINHDHQRRELRLARQLDHGASDGASVGVERFLGDRHRDLAELTAVANDGDTTVVILARNEEARRELDEACTAHAIVADIRIGRLAAGFRDLEQDLLLVHDFELAKRKPARRRTTKVSGGTPLDSLTDLKPGDFVVHVTNGIARFRGMATLERRGYLEDFLLLEFADEAKLYVPVTAIDLIQKYIGGSGKAPELSKLGSKVWARRKAKAEQAVADLTAELLTTQAQRSISGLACDEDGPAIRRFEAAFPYEETEDQLSATREIKRDMETATPMDRLLCGDVGFGKTEIAMRAAFKAVASGYQVALLAPTTLLTEQHLSSFAERFATIDCSVACLNRFRSNDERRAILDGIHHGDIDILIGTHAVLGKDLRFANLGLLIIDEEHRFGVKHKEQLKQVRAGVDVLTLSATPIPRTLHFSLLGLRDISVLAEAPALRLAVETRVAPWDDHLVRSAIEREIEREGQVFIVHNRVKDLDQLAFRLERLVPDMRLAVLHGQMDENTIGQQMQAFRAGAIDCLVATSIIESGIDVPNANTLIVNNAHAFGLAELHQIRGRIGRYTRQAYAYFLTQPGRDLSEDAAQRLAAIEEYCELGAGFKLAMRDLELRGAGNLLGPQQSGQIDAVGYELYCKMLADAVRRSGLATDTVSAGQAGVSVRSSERVDSVLAFALDAFVPDDFLDAPSLKFDFHKGLDRCRSAAEIRTLARTTRDRYGPLPPPVIKLIRARALRLAAGNLGISRVEVRDRHLHLSLSAGLPAALTEANLPELLHVQVDGETLILFTRISFNQDSTLDFLERLLGCTDDLLPPR